MATAVKDPHLGTVVGERYEVRGRIASGGMGTVYLAHDLRLERDVALKVMHAHLASDSTFVARFTREARSAAGISHPGIVAVYDQGADSGAVYLAMEHVPGRTLRDVLVAKGALRLREALDVTEEVLAALGAAHRAGLVHRDVKPENILISSGGRLKVVDFGLARAAMTGDRPSSTLIGTVGYLAPEILRDGVADARADVYAVGVVLVELLTGRPPFSGAVPAQVAFRHVHEDMPAPSTLRPALPVAVDDLVRWATSRDPQTRPVDADEFLAALRRVRAMLADADLDAVPQLADSSPEAGGYGGDGDAAVRGQTAAFAGTHAELAADAGHAAAEGATRPLPPPAPGPRPPLEGAGAPRRGEELPLLSRTRPLRRRWSRRWTIALLVALLVVAGGSAWAAFAGPLRSAVVPRTAGESAADAREALGLRHLDHVKLVQAHSSSVDAGRVSASTPAPGTRVLTTSTVTLTVSTGPLRRSVPDLSGLSLTSARRALASAGLRLGEVSKAYSETLQDHAIVSQSSRAGQSLRAGSAVDVTVSKGRQPIDVPSLIGQSRDAASAALSDLGLALGDTSVKPSEGIAAGLVMDQSPTGGTLFAGQGVDLVISSGPPTSTVPSVVGEGVDQAVADLQKAGLEATVNKVWGAPTGIVRQQDPAGGEVPAGSAVTLTVF